MKLFKSVGIALTMITLLQACGGSSNSTTKKVTIAEPKTVHGIQPNKVASYIDNFKTENAKVDFQFEGKKYDINFTDFGEDKLSAVAQFERGFIVFGFDQNKDTPIANLSIVEANNDKNSVLKSSTITVKKDGGNFIYEGTVENAVTQGLFSVRLVINESFFGAGNSTLNIVDNTAILNGTLGTKTYIQIDELTKNNSNVDTLILQAIDGSINDDINMHTGRLIRQAKLTTVVPANGDINSGGVDLFAAGFKREYNKGGKVGVHSWCCVSGKSAHLLNKDDEAHGAQLTYFREILGKELGPEFYYFTINAAPASSIYIMTPAELIKYLISK